MNAERLSENVSKYFLEYSNNNNFSNFKYI